MSSSTEFQAQCHACGQQCRVVPIHHRDGRIEPHDIYCLNRACELHGRDQRLHDVPHDEVTLNGDFSFTHRAVGRPEQGEDNQERVARVFMFAANRDYAMNIASYRCLRDRDSRLERGVDVELLDDAGKVLRRLQVTRAPLNRLFAAQARLGRGAERLSRSEAVALLRSAIERKQDSAASDVDLVVDGTKAIELAFGTEQILAAQDAAWLTAQGWRGIWVVGPSWLKRLASGVPQ